MRVLQVHIEQISNVVEIIDPVTFKRPIYTGNAIETVRYKGSGLKLLTFRASSFPDYEGQHASTNEESHARSEIEFVPDALIEKIKTQFPRSFNNTMSKWWEDIWESSTGMPKLSHAKIVLAGGRGLKNKEGFKRLEGLAQKLGAAVGATRAAVDAGYASNDLQIGQSGKIVAPDLYIAFGISGAIQHLAGIKDSKTIVAINSDPEAPIFKVLY
jgi:electron transfer flavoprotein alpha subunit